MQSNTIDSDFVRRQYRAFNTGESADWAFFENAGGSYIPDQVLNQFIDFLSHFKVQPYAPYALSQRAGDAMDAGYSAIADLLAVDEDELTIGPSTTLNTYVLANALRDSIKPGDEIIVTNQDHEANIGAWRRLERNGALIREWRIDPESGRLNADDLENLLSDRTRLVCFTLCSNIVADLHDVRALTQRIRPTGALVVGDGVSFAPHQVLDVKNSGLDVFLYSTYKTFAPHTGVMWINPERIAEFEPQGHFFNADLPHYRMNPTGPLHAEIGALGGLRNYYEDIHCHHFSAQADLSLHQCAREVCSLFAAHEAVLGNHLLSYLNQRPDVRIIGQKHIEGNNRAATIAFVSDGCVSSEIASRLAEYQVGCSSGHFYARRCIEALGIDPDDGVVRISMVHYNTMEEVDRVIKGLEVIL